MRSAFLTALVLGSAPAAAAPRPARPAAAAVSQPAPIAPAAPQTGMIDLSLIEALTAVELPQFAGLFSYIPEQNAPFAFADLLVLDKKYLKRYLKKLGNDVKVANGLTPWDHAVCAVLITKYETPSGSAVNRPDKKRMTQINECMLTPIISLQELVMRRRQ